MKKHAALLAGVATIALAFAPWSACGGSISSVEEDDGGGTGGGSADGGSGADGTAGGEGGGACVSPEPAEGSACIPGQRACGPSNPCCAGYVWTCDTASRTWKTSGVRCACKAPPPDGGVFACGASNCRPSDYCEYDVGGAQLDDGGTRESASCHPLPAACAATPTCSCVSGAGGGCKCDDTSGHVIITCQVP